MMTLVLAVLFAATGALSPFGEEAKWIASSDPSVTPRFVRTFQIDRPIVSATLDVTGVGFYVAHLNGSRIGTKVLDPAMTDYDDRVLYSTYRLDTFLRKGENELALTVGHGWYDVRTPGWEFERAPWKGKPRAIARLEIAYLDGTRDTVVTDSAWEETESPILYDCIREGEVRTGAPTPLRRPCVVVAAPKGRLEPERQPGAEVVETIAPKAIYDLGDGRWFVDFGVNLSGWLRATFRNLPAGRVVDIRYDERSDEGVRPPAARIVDKCFKRSGCTNGVSVASAFQTDHYIAGGRAVETFEPDFVYHGFRFVTLSGLAERPRPEDLKACFVHTAFRRTGRFRSSDATLNRLMEMADRSYRSNWTDGVPTDCPHREKNGWTGDASMASELAQYLYENTAGYEKWLNDVMDAQRADGMVPGICPTGGWGFDFKGWGGYPGPCWDGALTVIPWTLYAYRGDRAILEKTYGAICRNVTFWEGERTRSPAGLIPEGLGDWCVPRGGYDGIAADRPFVTTAWHRQNLLIAAQIARTLGKPDDVARFAAWAEKTKDAINERFLDRANGLYPARGILMNQTMQAAALAFDIVPRELRPLAEKQLIACMAERDDHLDVGIQGLRVLLRQLSRLGRTDLALKALLQPTAPSFVTWSRECSTLYENWGGTTSLNHIMFGDFAAWAYQYLAGIRLTDEPDACGLPVPAEPGFRRFVIKPAYVDALDFVEASTECPFGTIESAWRRTKGAVELRVTIPSGTTADVLLPDGTTKTLTAGRYTF